MKILNSAFYNRDTVLVARELLGKRLVRVINGQHIIGIICETEAYTFGDPASHCYNKKTERNKSMFGPVGHAYVYTSYGIHSCINAVSRDTTKSIAGGTLIRSVIPLENIDIMIKNRGQNKLNLTNLTNGPGKVTQAFLIKKDHNGVDLKDSKSNLFILDQDSDFDLNSKKILATPRIGISKATDKLWRFVIAN